MLLLKLFTIGDSAGGNLAIALAMLLKHELANKLTGKTNLHHTANPIEPMLTLHIGCSGFAL